MQSLHISELEMNINQMGQKILIIFYNLTTNYIISLLYSKIFKPVAVPGRRKG